MMCPICGCATTVIKTRHNSRGDRCRRRECLDCGHRFTTYEQVIQIESPTVVGDDSPKKSYPNANQWLGIALKPLNKNKEDNRRCMSG